MGGDCDVSMPISKFGEEDLLVLSDDKQTETETETEACVGVGELNDITTQNDLSEEESLEVNTDIDWNHEFPPLVTPNTIKVLSVEDPSTSTWVDALKKPCCPKLNGHKSNVNGDQYCDSDSQLKPKSIDEHELASSFFSINIPNFHDKFLNEQISLAELREAVEQEMFAVAEEYLKTPNKALKASGLKVESVAVVTPKHSNGDLNEDVSVDKVEEMEGKEQKVEMGEEEKREKKRQKRLD
ncbi:uncharacterized protein LOC121764906 [Salvia splendens]|uniref:uncharacterized protein LOC121764906 n=1 Tax=Salvia splendens TaxID=180675 RepID=UPI001C26133E|nr:uncharacterized protein LOC121764906 [Salvia splendens]